jgi:hypothetical protein
VVAATVSLGDEGAKLTLTALELATFQGVEGIFDLLGHGLSVGGGGVGVICVLEGMGQEGAAGLIGCGIERVGWCWRVGEGFEERGGGKAVVPLGMLD